MQAQEPSSRTQCRRSEAASSSSFCVTLPCLCIWVSFRSAESAAKAGPTPSESFLYLFFAASGDVFGDGVEDHRRVVGDRAGPAAGWTGLGEEEGEEVVGAAVAAGTATVPVTSRFVGCLRMLVGESIAVIIESISDSG